MRLMWLINRISRSYTMYRNNQLEGEGINGYQHRYILWICNEPGIPQDELVRQSCVHKSSVARQLALLEQNGFITRAPCPTDRRQLLVYPTGKAEAVLPRVRAVRDWWNSRLLEEFTPQEREQLESMLARLAEKADQVLKDPERGGEPA